MKGEYWCLVCGTVLRKGTIYVHFCACMGRKNGVCPNGCGKCPKTSGITGERTALKTARDYIRTEVRRLAASVPGLAQVSELFYATMRA